jgi:signal transduction histidine kinase
MSREAVTRKAGLFNMRFELLSRFTAARALIHGIASGHMTTQEHDRRHAQRLELIGNAASGVAHDLNNQLTVILNHLDYALDRIGPDHEVTTNLEDVRSAANRCADIVGTLARLGRRHDTKFQCIDLEPVLSETVRLVRRSIPSRIRTTLTVDPGLLRVVANGTQIQQILINLLINARDSIPYEGAIEVSAGNYGGRVVLTVHDTGCGIPPESLARVFEPFFTTKTETGGTGIGLAMAAAIAEEHGGTIVVESEPGRGTSFQLSLPGAHQLKLPGTHQLNVI